MLFLKDLKQAIELYTVETVYRIKHLSKYPLLQH